MDMSLIQGTISSLKAASDIAGGFLKLKTSVDIQGKVIELQSAILSAQSSALAANADQAAMAEEIRALKEELAHVKAWETQRQRYKLTTPWSSGVAYALRESMKESDPPHLLCTNCYENGRKSILNPTHDVQQFVFYVCPICNSQIPTGYRGNPVPEYAID